MYIRCPKCRYRFEETIADGLAEVRTVCPICGTPFLIDVPMTETESVIKEDKSVEKNTIERPDVPMTDYEKSLRDIQTRKMNGQYEPKRKGHGCLVFVLLLLALLVFFYCNRNSISQQSDDIEPTDQFLSITDSDHSDTIPQWLEGNWIGFHKGDTITLTINDHNFAVTRSNTITSGVLRAYGNNISCLFSPDIQLSGELHPQRQQIEFPLSEEEGKVKLMKTEDYRRELQQKAIAEAERRAKERERKAALMQARYNKPATTKQTSVKKSYRKYKKSDRRRRRR